MPEVLFLAIHFRSIEFSGEPRQSFFIYVQPQWDHTRNPHINPQIEFKSIDQQRIFNVLAYHQRRVLFQTGDNHLQIVTHDNPFTLGSIMRFYDVDA